MNKKPLIIFFLNGLLIFYLLVIMSIAYLHEKITDKRDFKTPPAEIRGINPTFLK